MNSNLFYENMRNYTPKQMEPGQQAAVLLAFIFQNGSWSLLFQQRAKALRRQPGEICLPGGMVEAGESPRQAALRETCEELLVRPDQLSFWGAGDILHTPGGQTIHPFFAQLQGYGGSFSKKEVHSTFTVPVDWLLENPPAEYIARIRTCPCEDFPYELIPGGESYPWREGRWPVFFYTYEDKVIWGITAKIVSHSLALIGQLGGFPAL